MRRALLLTSSLLAFTTSTFAADLVKIHGIITHPLADSVTVSYANGNLDMRGEPVTAHLTADGYFSLSFRPKYKITSIQLKNGNQGTQTFVNAGDDLTVSVDAQNFDNTLHYEGKGSEIGNFMAEYVRRHGLMYHYGQQIGPYTDKEAEAYMSSLQTEFDKQKIYLDAYGKNLPPDLKDYWLAYFRYYNYKAMLEYPAWHQIGKQHSFQGIQMDTADYRVVEAVPKAFNDDYAGLDMYNLYAQMFYVQKLFMKKRRPRDPDSASIIHDMILDSMYANLPPRTAEIAIAGQIEQYSSQLPQTYHVKCIKLYLQHFPNSGNKEAFQKVLQIIDVTAPGKPAIDFSFKTADGKDMKLSDLKGKVVYIDFWASWCGACMMEMQIAKDLMPSFKDKDVAFLFASLDESADKWQQARANINIDGIHTLLGAGFDNPVAHWYNISALPASFLIDKNGNFAVEHAPRPSEKKAFTAAIEKAINN